MPTYKGGVTTVAPVSGAAYCTIHTGALRRGFLSELGMFLSGTSAVVSPVSLGIPANTPVASTSLVVPATDINDATCLTNIDTAWSTPPTAPAAFDAKGTLGASIGQGIIWIFTKPLIIPKSGWLVLWNHGASTAGTLDVTWTLDE